MRGWLRGSNRQGNDPFSRPITGDFTTPDIIEVIGNEGRKNVELGAKLQREASRTPTWAICGYFALLTIAAIVFFTSPNHSELALGFIVGQAPLLLKELAKS
jgi:hypothetical protein